MAMVLFGSRVTRVINFEDSHKGLDAVQEKIMSVKHQREGMTSTASALNYVKEAILGQVGNNRKVAELRFPLQNTSTLFISWLNNALCKHLIRIENGKQDSLVGLE